MEFHPRPPELLTGLLRRESREGLELSNVMPLGRALRLASAELRIGAPRIGPAVGSDVAGFLAGESSHPPCIRVAHTSAQSWSLLAGLLWLCPKHFGACNVNERGDLQLTLRPMDGVRAKFRRLRVPLRCRDKCTQANSQLQDVSNLSR